ncbi:hypothetical protein BJ170DRAFT_682464 [Xylariales sp. AK1849]|nr:hypothetical protein BJ170DRAFT_682464 [Xylariales sp. AK1849]
MAGFAPADPPPTSSMEPTTASTTLVDDSSKAEPGQATLAPLTPAEFRAYNNMAEHMEIYHNHFRQTWNLLWDACVANKRPSKMSAKDFITEGLQFIRHLTMHHDIEERYIFPVLAKKMPEFKAGKGNGAAELLRQHREIHKGMDGLEEYLKVCYMGEQLLELRVLKEKLESWGTVLWAHLDQEVKTLGAENMRKYWSVEEMRTMPM